MSTRRSSWLSATIILIHSGNPLSRWLDLNAYIYADSHCGSDAYLGGTANMVKGRKQREKVSDRHG
jgi:hypothetical protein